jgi:hypothetical protein
MSMRGNSGRYYVVVELLGPHSNVYPSMLIITDRVLAPPQLPPSQSLVYGALCE